MFPLKHIVLPHAFNLRDLGGLPTKDGQAVAWQLLYRADGLHNLTEPEWQTLYERGVRTVVDLRSVAETQNMPDCPPEGIRWVHCPLQTENLDMQHLDEGAAIAFQNSMAQSYTDMAQKTPQLLATAVCTVAEALQNGAVIFHCTAGKDRTGVLAATLLTLLGAYEDDILADYEVSNTYNRNGLHKQLERLPNFSQMRSMLSSDRKNLEPLLALYADGNAERILLANGCPQTMLDALRGTMLRPL